MSVPCNFLQRCHFLFFFLLTSRFPNLPLNRSLHLPFISLLSAFISFFLLSSFIFSSRLFGYVNAILENSPVAGRNPRRLLEVCCCLPRIFLAVSPYRYFRALHFNPCYSQYPCPARLLLPEEIIHFHKALLYRNAYREMRINNRKPVLIIFLESLNHVFYVLLKRVCNRICFLPGLV